LSQDTLLFRSKLNDYITDEAWTNSRRIKHQSQLQILQTNVSKSVNDHQTAFDENEKFSTKNFMNEFDAFVVSAVTA
jgi:hypothetical protein